MYIRDMMNKLVAVPLEEGEEIVGYLREIQEIEDEWELVAAILYLPESDEEVGVITYPEDIQVRMIH